ncbi:hypothetical protein PHLGIDRAFT_116319 [Phlebiopsis gigantea 11061_1 CR5-6]|uniref:Uncharacterized protein n=1 Tax=Phlebiopsis gigantea (strain 11061_1 CR5-6) TaxID=745531 RepID=A0A0C3SDB0_PHLG1|nr:hypothetical protein PHLGIDRAFT_116319 [Phlebiopsis gigantea 11061_1 CR5-6]
MAIAHRQIAQSHKGIVQVTHAVKAQNPVAYTGGMDRRDTYNNTFMAGANPYNVRDGTMMHELHSHPAQASDQRPPYAHHPPPQGYPQPPPGVAYPGYYPAGPPPPPQDAPLYSIPAAPTSVSARPLPDNIFESLETSKIARALNKAQRDDPEKFAAVMMEESEKAQRTLHRANPNTMRKIAAWLRFYFSFLKKKHPNLPRERYFHPDTVYAETRTALRLRVLLTKGKQGRAMVAAITVRCFHTAVVAGILAYCCYDNGEPAGVHVLIVFISTLDSPPPLVITEHQLHRYPFERFWCGESELSLILSGIFHNIEFKSAAEAIISYTLACQLVLVFLGTFRVSTLAGGAREFAEQGKFMKLGDFVFHCRGMLRFELDCHIKHFKGFNDAVAAGQHMRYRSVEEPKNLILCAATWFALTFLARGAFHIKTLEELVAYKGAQLTVLPEKADEPLQVFFSQHRSISLAQT